MSSFPMRMGVGQQWANSPAGSTWHRGSTLRLVSVVGRLVTVHFCSSWHRGSTLRLVSVVNVTTGPSPTLPCQSHPCPSLPPAQEHPPLPKDPNASDRGTHHLLACGAAFGWHRSSSQFNFVKRFFFFFLTKCTVNGRSCLSVDLNMQIHFHFS